MFSYCGNSPINRIDADGNSYWDIVKICAVALAAPILALAAGGAVASAVALGAASVATGALTYGICRSNRNGSVHSKAINKFPIEG